MSRTTQILLQLGLIALSLFVAFFWMNQTGMELKRSDASEPDGYEMLDYLDQKIACQEDVKDVRCWSSVSKFQMFAAGASIEHEALGVRIEEYDKFIDSIWTEASNEKTDQISKSRLLEVLMKRFPHEIDSETKAVSFKFPNQQGSIMVLDDLIVDYSDTIEAWRLLQSWAARRTDRTGQLIVEPVFSQPAIDAFRDFLVAFDIALLRKAAEIANSRKLSIVDAASMKLAFNGEPPKQSVH